MGIGANNKILYGIIAIAFAGGMFTIAYAGPILPMITFAGNTHTTGDADVDGNLNVDGTITGDIADGTITQSDLAFDTIPLSVSDCEGLGDWGVWHDGELWRCKQIRGSVIQENTITGSHIQLGEITGAHIQFGTVTGGDIKDGTVTGADISDDSITSADIADGSITGTDIADGSITGTDIADGSVTGTDVADDSITSADIADGSVTGTDIADDTITFFDIADNAVRESEIANSAVGSGEIASNAVGSHHIAADAVGLSEIDVTITGYSAQECGDFASPSCGDSNVETMIPADGKSFCFLTFVYTQGSPDNKEDRQSCHITIVDGNWRLEANVESATGTGDDLRASCSARCVQFN